MALRPRRRDLSGRPERWRIVYADPMKAVVVGCGRVGSSVALQLAAEGWDVSCIDENEDALARLGAGWRGGFVVGHGMDVAVLRRAGIDDADAVVVATDGDNTNLVVGQVAQKRFGVDCVVVRVLDPARADFYAQRGLRTVSPTQTAISVLTDIVRACDVRPLEPTGAA
jgi:trk system potassium uptake protein TrkA